MTRASRSLSVPPGYLDPPFQLIIGSPGKAQLSEQGRTDPPGMVEDEMNAENDVAPFVTHASGLDDSNTAFALVPGVKSIRTDSIAGRCGDNRHRVYPVMWQSVAYLDGGADTRVAKPKGT